MEDSRASDISVEFAKLFRKCRSEGSGYTQIELQKESGVNRITISRLENAATIVSKATFEKLLTPLRMNNSPSQINQLEKAYEDVKVQASQHNNQHQSKISRLVDAAKNRWPDQSLEWSGFIADIENSVALWERYYFATVDLESGDPERAEILLTEILDSIGDRRLLKMLVLEKLAISRRSLGNPTENVVELLDQAIKIADENPNIESHEKLGEIWLLKGDNFRRNGLFEDAQSAYTKASENFGGVREIHHRMRLLAQVDRKISGILLYKGESREAGHLLTACITRLKGIDDKSSLRKAEQHLAWSMALEGEFDKALEIHEKHLESFNVRGQHDLLELAKSQSYHGDILRMCHRYKEAEKTFMASRRNLDRYTQKIFKEKETLIKGPIFVGLGQTQTALEKYDEAFLSLQESERLNESFPFFLARTYSAQGNLLLAQGEYDEANKKFDLAETTFSNIGNIYYEIAVLVNKARVMYLEKDYSACIATAREAVQSSDPGIVHAVHKVRANLLIALSTAIQRNSGDPIEALNQCFDIAVFELENLYLIIELADELEEARNNWGIDLNSQLRDYLISLIERIEGGNASEFQKQAILHLNQVVRD